MISRRKSSGGSGANSHSSSSSSRSKAKALNEFKELMREVERKRVYRVGLNLFNSQPDLGIEFLVQKDFLELSPLSVAKFLKTNPGKKITVL